MISLYRLSQMNACVKIYPSAYVSIILPRLFTKSCVCKDFKMNIPRRFIGIVRLYGEEIYQKFANSHVCVIGLGGVGSWVTEALVRSGVGHLTLIDLDHVAESNINRQLGALDSTLGQAKVEVLAKRLQDINPAVKLCLIEDFVDERNYQTLFAPAFSCVIDAIDQLKIKVILCHYFCQKGQPFVVCGAAGGKISARQVEVLDLSEVTHDRILAKLRYQLRKKFAFPLTGAMGISCVCSKENIQLPLGEHPDKIKTGLSCDGYGSSMVVTAAFAMQLVEVALAMITSGSTSY